jgi:hypothetical protein
MMMELSGIISIISLIMQVIEKLAFFAICLYYGNIALKGWKGKKNMIFQVIAIIILGLISFFGGIILKEFLGLDFILSEYLTSLAIAFACFFLMSFISTAFEVKDNYATKMDLSAIMNDLKELKIQVAKISKALEDEKISPKELTEEDIKEKIRAGLDEKGLKKYSIISLEKHADYWTAKISGSKEVIIDAYTGKINEISQSANPLAFLYKKPLFSIGIILSLTLIGFLLANLNQSAINAFNDAFDFSFLTVPALPDNCIKASVLLESLNKSDINPATGVNISFLNKTIFDRTGTYLVSDKTRKASYNNSNFIISVSYESATSDIVSELTDSPMENIYKIRVCALRDDYEICECIGDKQADPAFTVPYLINLDLINDAILNAIQGLLPAGLAGLLGQ